MLPSSLPSSLGSSSPISAAFGNGNVPSFDCTAYGSANIPVVKRLILRKSTVFYLILMITCCCECNQISRDIAKHAYIVSTAKHVVHFVHITAKYTHRERDPALSLCVQDSKKAEAPLSEEISFSLLHPPESVSGVTVADGICNRKALVFSVVDARNWIGK